MQKYAMFGYMFDKYGHCFGNRALLVLHYKCDWSVFPYLQFAI